MSKLDPPIGEHESTSDAVARLSAHYAAHPGQAMVDLYRNLGPDDFERLMGRRFGEVPAC